MKLLALDTATENCSVAYFDGEHFYQQQELAMQKHGNLILPMLDNLAKEHNFALKDVDYICYNMGPGSFTGVRIGVSTAQGLAFALNKELIGVSSLKILAKLALDTQKGICISAIDARMGEVYLAVYESCDVGLKCLVPECVISPSQALTIVNEYRNSHINKIYYAGTGIAVLNEHDAAAKLECSVTLPDSCAILKIVVEDFTSCLPMQAQQAMPLYVRNDVTWKKISQQ